MWIERLKKHELFLNSLNSLNRQAIFVRGARQTGKTSFILNALESGAFTHRIYLNLSIQGSRMIDGREFFGRSFFGSAPDASQLLQNLRSRFGPLEKLSSPLTVLIDEADQHPVSLEAVQELAELTPRLKVIYTGSNLENTVANNAATGRKLYLDLYPISFEEFLNAYDKNVELNYLRSIDLSHLEHSEFYHDSLSRLFDLYLRIGGMPRVLRHFLDFQKNGIGKLDEIPLIVSDLVSTIEENVKSILGDKFKSFEYEDILRKLAHASINTLKISRLQSNHASRADAKKILNKTVGARVAHKIRLFDDEADLSKYILFDAGILNFLLNGSDLLNQKITANHLAIQYENTVGIELVHSLPSRDDLCYWKSSRGAEVEYLLRSPSFCGIDVKSTKGNTKSLQSCAVFEPELECVVKISKEPPSWIPDFEAQVPHHDEKRTLPLVVLPHYCAGRLREILAGFNNPP